MHETKGEMKGRMDQAREDREDDGVMHDTRPADEDDIDRPVM